MESLGPVIDLARGASPTAVAEAQFYSLVARTALADGRHRGIPTGFVTGSQRTDAQPADILEGWQIRGDWRTGHNQCVIGELRSRYAMVSSNSYDGSITIEVYSDKGPKDAEAGLTALLMRCPAVPEPEHGIEARFWYATGMGPHSHVRQIDAPDWSEVEGNYPPGLRDEVSDLASWATAPSGSGGRLLLMHGPPGTGKAQPLDAPVLTPSGWRPIGDLHVGDLVFGPDGSHRKVTAVHPQGVVPIYRCTFSDGSEVECCANHQWLTQSADQRKNGRPGRVRPLHEVAANLTAGAEQRANQWIPMIEAGIDLDLGGNRPLDAYLLGLLIGDGHMPGPEQSLTFSSADAATKKAVESLLPDGYECIDIDGISIRIVGHDRRPGKRGSGLLRMLNDLGLRGTQSYDKFVPSSYLWASADDRLSVLQGLLDSDGSADRSVVEFSTVSPQLAADVRFLVESLGGTVTQSERQTGYTYGGERRIGRLSYRVFIRLPHELDPFRLERKLIAYAPNRTRLPRRSFTAVDFVGNAEAVCISLDAEDGLYVTSDFVVTHNTFVLRSLARAWRGWGDLNVITDPDEFFGQSAYMLSVLLNGETDYTLSGDDSPARWRVVIVEDCDEILSSNARERSGHAVSRLLNVCDGMVGQGLRILMLLTTNETVDNFHPAIVRPGRCLKNLHFGLFNGEHADAWRSEHGLAVTGDDASLADLYSETREARKVQVAKVAAQLRSQSQTLTAVAGS